MSSWKKRHSLDLIKLYQNKTGILEFQMEDVAAWAAGRLGIDMPIPDTPEQLLTKKLKQAAQSERRSDEAANLDYRGMLAGKKFVNGEETTFWFDADGPAATRTNMASVEHLRHEQMINDGVRYASDLIHWNRTHPKEKPLQTSLDLTDEVKWRMNAPEQDDKGKDEKAS